MVFSIGICIGKLLVKGLLLGVVWQVVQFVVMVRYLLCLICVVLVGVFLVQVLIIRLVSNSSEKEVIVFILCFFFQLVSNVQCQCCDGQCYVDGVYGWYGGVVVDEQVWVVECLVIFVDYGVFWIGVYDGCVGDVVVGCEVVVEFDIGVVYYLCCCGVNFVCMYGVVFDVVVNVVCDFWMWNIDGIDFGCVGYDVVFWQWQDFVEIVELYVVCGLVVDVCIQFSGFDEFIFFEDVLCFLFNV